MTLDSTQPRVRLESIEELMLSATELFHYSYKFRNQTTVITLQDPTYLFALLPDFRVLASSHVGAAVFMCGAAELQTQIEACNIRGHAFTVAISGTPEDDAAFIQKSIQQAELPVLLCPVDYTEVQLCETAFDAARIVQAIKLFYVQAREGLFVEGRLLSHPTTSELQTVLEQQQETSIDSNLLTFLSQTQQAESIDVAIIGNGAGALFQELFTHRGSGTLLTTTYPNIIRTATAEDIAELSLLLAPYIKAGSLLPIAEETLALEISQFHVFTINGEIVAAARLRQYENACELGKFCTLPRYQRKGRARLLALSLISMARDLRKEYTFALSLEPGMWAFFLGLGFRECTYAELPRQWLDGYDQSRGSKAFRLDL
jgi:N-acetylglutamate synthase-like GNAT family acetyltransferase